MEKVIKPFFTMSGLMRGASRVVSLQAGLVRCSHKKNADYLALKSDWERIGEDIRIAMDQYVEKEPSSSLSRNPA